MRKPYNKNFFKERVRDKLPETIAEDLKNLTITLTRTVKFMTMVLDDDLYFCKEYYKKFGDLRYRPPGPNGDYGDPQNIDIQLKADTMGHALKRVVDTISTIENKLSSMKENEEQQKKEKPKTEADKASEAQAKSQSAKERAKKLLEQAKNNVEEDEDKDE
jgi:hypothetical protein